VEEITCDEEGHRHKEERADEDLTTLDSGSSRSSNRVNSALLLLLHLHVYSPRTVKACLLFQLYKMKGRGKTVFFMLAGPFDCRPRVLRYKTEEHEDDDGNHHKAANRIKSHAFTIEEECYI